jgi:hypothetical protein
MNAPTNTPESVSVDQVYRAGYHRGIQDALDQLAEIARDPRRLRGVTAVAEARRLLGVNHPHF